MTLVERLAYTLMYVCRLVFHAVWLPVVPLKAIPGTPSLTASVAAPTVPEMRTVGPRFAGGSSVSSVCERLEWGGFTADVKARDCNIRRAAEVSGREGLNAIAHAGYGVRVHVVEAGHGVVEALGRGAGGAGVVFAGFGEGSGWHVC